MFTFLRVCLRRYRQLAVVASLVFASAVCTALLLLRIVHTHRLTHLYLLWNLFLAWLPMICSLVAYNFYKRSSRLSGLFAGGCILVWLLFFPNAPYLLTDLIHLQPQENVPFWFDLILIVTFALTGFFLGLISLVLMQAIVRKTLGAIVSWIFAVGVLGVSGFGIYLGRFLRWNSWDVIVNPRPVLFDIWLHLRHPLANFQTLVFSALFSLFLLAAYLILMSVTHLSAEPDWSN
ncbi:MAG: DUF1361 domain-containing protein [Anaerolineae bacterium]|nr:DUF1361 domain-containing protein [Anaerolineae bacterium]